MTASSSIGSRWIGGLEVPSEELTEDAADDSSALESPNIAECVSCTSVLLCPDVVLELDMWFDESMSMSSDDERESLMLTPPPMS